jgi:mRNA interferase HigB
MKVHLLKLSTIEDFVKANVQSKSSFGDWLEKLKHADWQAPADIAGTYASADLLGKGSDRVIFDIAGNNYRMICKYWFGGTKVHLYIKWIGTHAQYDHLCNGKQQYTIEDY